MNKNLLWGKILILVLFVLSFFSSCEDQRITPNSSDKMLLEQKDTSMSRLIFSSRDILANTILALRNGKSFRTLTTRAVSGISTTEPSQNFISLIDAEKNTVLSKLSQLQLDSIKNDPENLEYSPSDSIIADAQFAQLVNANREIQVGDTVYKYFGNGVAYAPVQSIKELEDFNPERYLSTTRSSLALGTRTIVDNVHFQALQYRVDEFDEDASIGGIGGGSSTTPNPSSTSNILKLNDGTIIPEGNIRSINYYDKGDGSFFHRLWNGLWGRNVVAINKFSKRRKLCMNFFDQNYIVYANIGTTVKMQKKVCGIWWNIKAQEIVQGWNCITLKCTFDKPVIQNIPSNSSSSSAVKPEFPDWFRHQFPFQDETELLFHVGSLDVTTEDLNSAFRSGVAAGLKKLPDFFKNEIQKLNKPVGIYTANDNNLYMIIAPSEKSSYNTSKETTKFYSKILPTEFSLGFSVGENGLKFSNFQLKNCKDEYLYKGIVYAAVKYDNRWLGARIIKNYDKN